MNLSKIKELYEEENKQGKELIIKNYKEIEIYENRFHRNV